ncbi:MAG: tRNA lysidine(34) synthetase TilS, partial [Spirochaetota bacterium]|nr:tRNA lysidine(34) synthetase TilS [Spirochaetota bacterium]
MTLLDKFIQTIENEKLVQKKDKLLIALSAGPDSLCLFHLIMSIMAQYSIETGIAHVNYHLRGAESDNEANYIQKLSTDKGIKLHQLDYPIAGHSNIQELARDIRYGFFKELCRDHGYTKVCLGHHLDDQVETFLLRLFRGSSLTGLGSMSYKSNLAGLTLVRPLLDVTKSDITEYLDRHGLEYYTDSSNKKPDYLRNRLRLDLIPVIENIFPDYRHKLQKLLGHIKETNDFSESIISKSIKKITLHRTPVELTLSIIEFNKLHVSLRKNILLTIARQLGTGWHYFSSERLTEIIAQLESQDVMGSYHLYSKKDIDMLVEYSSLTVKNRVSESPVAVSEIELKAGYSQKLSEIIPDSDWHIHVQDVIIEDKSIESLIDRASHSMNNMELYINQDNIRGTLSLRRVRQGDRIFLSDKTGKKPVKEILINQKIPNRLRQNVLLVCDDLTAIAIISLAPHTLCRLSQKYFVTE